ncbi:MAG: hypothetical protein Q8N23_32855 [Archangium sp.]|nr:hypothetical protein [Archangium sp.]MDP3157505.1 hypothetical protein [Archangium sp.]MDP3572792.1 hypothetical protein [Archangium sp.]
MAQIVVRQLEEEVKVRLKRRAARHGVSMEAELRDILRDAVKGDERAPVKLGSRIASRFKKVGLTREIPELRGQLVRPADFKR